MSCNGSLSCGRGRRLPAEFRRPSDADQIVELEGAVGHRCRWWRCGLHPGSAPLRTPLELHSLGSGRLSDPDEPDSPLQPDQRNALLSVELNDTVVEDMISPTVVNVD